MHVLRSRNWILCGVRFLTLLDKSKGFENCLGGGVAANTFMGLKRYSGYLLALMFQRVSLLQSALLIASMLQLFREAVPSAEAVTLTGCIAYS